ncbi:phytanoyl-CoA dioxygenase family protein [Dyella sp. ASV21]|uniref:phytanoyl-CoA dioxygenase family protein n=1 Tax=Dyella sp. ASV21 TaxID=2795114 RepID=UPI0018EDCB2F
MKFQEDGFTILPDAISLAACDELIAAISSRDLAKAGSRGLLGYKVIAHTADVLRQRLLGLGLLGEQHRPVQCSLFAKGDGVSWSVTPHQDLSVPVANRVDVPEWGGWSRKESLWFAQPPAAFLEDLIAVRLQLDANASETGPLEVVPGSHVLGRLASASVSKHAEHRVKCVVPRGGVLIMRPLLIHSSGKPLSPLPRRVLHYLYGPLLPTGLAWPSTESV